MGQLPTAFPVNTQVRCVFVLLLALGFSAQAQTYDLVVAKDGTGNFTTVQAAINAAPTGRTVPYTIFIKNGKYRERVTIPATKPFLQLTGESVAAVPCAAGTQQTLLHLSGLAAGPYLVRYTSGTTQFVVALRVE